MVCCADTPDVMVCCADIPDVMVCCADTADVMVCRADTPDVMVCCADTPGVMICSAVYKTVLLQVGQVFPTRCGGVLVQHRTQPTALRCVCMLPVAM